MVFPVIVIGGGVVCVTIGLLLAARLGKRDLGLNFLIAGGVALLGGSIFLARVVS